MADDPKDSPAKDEPTDDPKPKDDPKDDPTDLGEAGKKALEAERKARRAAEKSAKDSEARLKEIEDKDKSEVDKLREELDAAKKEATDAKLHRLRLEVASEKGLTPAQAKRLVGATAEELEADADEFLESIRPGDDKGKPPGKPQERLRGGGDPTEDPVETDPAKLAAMVPQDF